MSVLEVALQFMMDLKFLLAVLVLLFSLCIFSWGGNRKWPPGPRPLPLIGNYLDFEDKVPAFLQMTEWGKKFGDVICIKIGIRRAIVLNSLDTVREAFIHKGNEFAGRPRSFTGDLFSDGGKDIALGDFGPVWKMQRKIVHNAIRNYASGSHLEDLIHKSVEGLTKLFQRQEEPFYPLEQLTLMIYNFILMMCCGRQYEQDDTEFQHIFHAIEELNETFGNGLPHDFFPVLEYLPNRLFPSVARTQELLETVDQYLSTIMTEKRKNYNPDNVQDFVDLIIKYEREAESEDARTAQQLTPHHFKRILSDMFFAGTDTSRYTLVWTVSLLAAHPEIQTKMQEEIDSVIGADQPVFLRDKERLPYTNAVFHEVLRLRPVAAIAIPHKTMKDTSVGGYELPEGTDVIPNIWALHQDTREWTKPEQFLPERWIDEDGKFYTPSRSFLPFSTGSRVCVGEALAKAELLVFIAMIFQKFTFTPAPGKTLTQEMLDVAFGPVPAPFEVVVSPR